MEPDNKSGVENDQNKVAETSAPTIHSASTASTASVIDGTEPKNKLAFILGVVVLLAAAAFGYWYFIAETKTGGINEGPASARTVVDEEQVVARVNDKEITGAKLNPQILLLAQQGGATNVAELNDQTYAQLQSQALDSVINTELVSQAAAKAGITASEEAIEARWQEIVANIGGVEVAAARLAELGVTEEEFKKTLVDDILIEAYLLVNNDEADFAVSEAEARALYDQATNGQTEGVPSFEDVRFQIEAQLRFQKQQAVLAKVLEELRGVATVEILL